MKLTLCLHSFETASILNYGRPSKTLFLQVYKVISAFEIIRIDIALYKPDIMLIYNNNYYYFYYYYY